MTARRIVLTVGALLACWSALVGLVYMLADRPLPWLWALPPLLVALQWALGPLLVRSLYQISWCSGEQFAPLYRNREGYLHLGVVETDDPWVMTYGHARRRVDVLMTVGLLKLFADEPAELDAMVQRELALGDQGDLGAATAVAGPLLWCGVTDEFFLGGGRQSGVERGLGGGLYIGWLARVLYRVLAEAGAWSLAGRQRAADPRHSVAWDAALRRLCQALQAPVAGGDASLRRAYAARAAVVCPVDVAEIGRLALFDSDLERAAAQALSNPWERSLPHFHALLGERLGVSAGAVDAAYQASWRVNRARQLATGVLLAAAVIDVMLRHTDLGGPLMAVGLGWLLRLQGRYRIRPAPISIVPGGAAPWCGEPVVQHAERWWGLWWPPLVNLGVSPSPPSLRGLTEVLGWLRFERVPYVELKRVDRTANHAITLQVLAALAVIGMGALLNLVTGLSGW